MSTWGETIRELDVGSTFDDCFTQAYGARQWAPTDDDRRAARLLHIEIISRIATQALEYTEGVEERALTSFFEIFQRTRKITEDHHECAKFETIAWHVLNVHVRPFTARWHPRSVSGALRALDNSDSFRAELVGVQRALRDLDRVLQLIIGFEGYRPSTVTDRPGSDAIATEMDQSVTWRPLGIASEDKLANKERDHVGKRRAAYQLNPDTPWASGLALSGGGIRSATFSLGVLAALAKRDLLPQFDYMSTVSGGGYAGCFLTQLLGGSAEREEHGLKRIDKTFACSEGESEILQNIRQRASYLSGSFAERLGVATAQAYGVLANVLVLVLLAGAVASAEHLLRSQFEGYKNVLLTLSPEVKLAASAGFLFFGVLVGLLQSTILRTTLGFSMLAAGIWLMQGYVHRSVAYLFPSDHAASISLLLIVLPAMAAAAGVAYTMVNRIRPFLLSLITALFFLSIEVMLYKLFQDHSTPWLTLLAAGLGAALFLWLVLDVNRTSLHHYYRQKLAAAFLIKPNGLSARPSKLSELKLDKSPFPIINCSLNAPGSNNPRMRGRKCDLFSLTPVSAGALHALGPFQSIQDWESANPSLDLATAMALSGAAVSPQMGQLTPGGASFWLTLLNLRLNLWLRKPGTGSGGPGIQHLLRELTGSVDERGSMINVSDGGHIENLGVYELLRRRCRFIVAIDGESDPSMAFPALTNLQRLAYIDFGITVEVDLDDLRLDKSGLSRSHFQLCRILYPVRNQDHQHEIGYLVYLKLSLTGNEGEFIRGYKLDQPAFPHHSTLDQFFTEAQFEAYRALGEHIGDKLFLPAIVGELKPDANLEDWFKRLGRSILSERVKPT